MTAGKKRYHVIKDYDTNYTDSIAFEKGERVRIGSEFSGNEEWKDWVRCSGGDGREAWCPRQYLDIRGREGFFNRSYDARELSVRAGEILEVGEELNGFGYATNRDGRSGWVPLNCLEPAG